MVHSASSCCVINDDHPGDFRFSFVLPLAGVAQAVNRPFASLQRGEGLRVFEHSMIRPSFPRHGLVLAGAGPVAISDIPAAINSAVRFFIAFSSTDALASAHAVLLQRFASGTV